METEMSGRLLITGDLHGDTAALTMITRQLREGDALFVEFFGKTIDQFEDSGIQEYYNERIKEL